MDERAFKRLLIIVVASIIVIMLLKMGLTKTYTTLNKAAAEKAQAASTKPTTPRQVPTPPAVSEVIETPAASTISETTTVDLPASSNVSEAR